MSEQVHTARLSQIESAGGTIISSLEVYSEEPLSVALEAPALSDALKAVEAHLNLSAVARHHPDAHAVIRAAVVAGLTTRRSEVGEGLGVVALWLALNDLTEGHEIRKRLASALGQVRSARVTSRCDESGVWSFLVSIPPPSFNEAEIEREETAS